VPHRSVREKWSRVAGSGTRHKEDVPFLIAITHTTALALNCQASILVFSVYREGHCDTKAHVAVSSVCASRDNVLSSPECGAPASFVFMGIYNCSSTVHTIQELHLPSSVGDLTVSGLG
jgi:hypothetical protein